jgi:hypothetical protein
MMPGANAGLPGASAIYKYSIPVGIHKVNFNLSSPNWIFNLSPSITNFEIESYHYQNHYQIPLTKSSRSITSGKNNIRFNLTIEVKDYSELIPFNFRKRHLRSLFDGVSGIHYYDCRSTCGLIYAHENIIFGELMKWASDQTEIVITGDLPSVEDWDGIACSLDCSNPKKDWSFQNVPDKSDLMIHALEKTY